MMKKRLIEDIIKEYNILKRSSKKSNNLELTEPFTKTN